MKVPGFLWTAILALIPLIVQWIQGDYFSDQTWVSVAVIVLGAIAKLIEVLRPRATVRGLLNAEQAPTSTAREFFLG